MKKRLLAALVCLITVLALLPAAALAEGGTGIYVGSTEIEAETYYLNCANDDGTYGITKTGASDEAYNVYYADGVLTLNNAYITENHQSERGITAAICADGSLEIKLVNDSSVFGASALQSGGIYAAGDLTVNGSGSLTATGGAVSGPDCASFGLIARAIEIKGGTATAYAGTASGSTFNMSCGVYGGNITISGGTLEANGGEVTLGYSCGVYGINITASGGTLEANGGTATIGNSYGISNSNDIKASGGTLEANGGEAKSGSSFGVYTGNNAEVSGGTVTAVGDTASGSSHGVYAGNKVIVSGGTVTADGGEAKTGSSNGVIGRNDVIIKDGIVIATGSNAKITSQGIYSGKVVESDDGTSLFGDVSISGGTVTATGGNAAASCGIYSICDIKISGGTVTASGDETTTNQSYGLFGGNSVEITDGIVTATGGDLARVQSFGIFGYNRSTIKGGTVLATDGARACSSGLDLSDYSGICYITASTNKSGLPATRLMITDGIDSSELASYKYLLFAPGAADITEVTVSGTPGTAIVEAETGITLINATFKDGVTVDTDVSDWFGNMPGGLFAKITALNAEKTYAAVTFSGTPAAAGTQGMSVTIPADQLTAAYPLTVTGNANAKWNIFTPFYDNSPTTVYNDPSAPNATVALSGVGLDSGDMLITERDPEGSEYYALKKLAHSDDVFATYNISLSSGSKNTGYAMELTFDLNAKYAGERFTLVHQKADGTYEYFYTTADSNGDLTFGPLYELSPFMLVKGMLNSDEVSVPNTGERAQLTLYAAAIITVPAALAGIALFKRKRD